MTEDLIIPNRVIWASRPSYTALSENLFYCVLYYLKPTIQKAMIRLSNKRFDLTDLDREGELYRVAVPFSKLKELCTDAKRLHKAIKLVEGMEIGFPKESRLMEWEKPVRFCTKASIEKGGKPAYFYFTEIQILNIIQ